MTRSQPMRPPRGRTPSPILSGRVAALDSGFRCVRRCAQQSAHANPRPPLRSLPPVPPASRNGRATARAERERGRARGFFHSDRARSARESWISGVSTRKSLIVERTAAASLRLFAISRAAFATSPVFAPAAVALLSSLSISLKKKEKESEEGQGIGQNGLPRVECVLPSVTDAAYFLGHEFFGVAMPE
ncbi:Baseplate J family protein [Burkholderia oklahomensis]|nr:Baseplate J family protein [Burkholderia oklahomensis]